MGIVALLNKDITKFVVSTNVDGLHRRSGVPPSKLAELHGDVYLETCEKCGKEYLRNFEIHGDHKHHTGRLCEDQSCAGPLKDSIINFGENLPTHEVQITTDHSKKVIPPLLLQTPNNLTLFF